MVPVLVVISANHKIVVMSATHKIQVNILL